MSDNWNHPTDGPFGGLGPSEPGPIPRPSFQSPTPPTPSQGFGPRDGASYGSPSFPPSPGPQPQPQPSAQPTPEPAPAAKPEPKRRAGRSAGALFGVALLAAGVGAGSSVVVDRYLLDSPDPTPSISAPQDTDEGSATSTTPVVQADPNAPNWSSVSDVASRSVVAIQVQTDSGAGQGSGVVIDDQGHIITNNHVVNGANWLLITLGDRSYEGELVGTDPATDLAVIRIVNPPSDLTPMTWGDANKLVVGDPVMAIGNPLGLSGTVTTGIVSALDRPVTTRAIGESNRDTVVTAAIQTNAAINPGNSGGALVNGSGELVGITTSIASLPGATSPGGQAGNIGIGFAIGSEQAKHVAEQLIESGTAQHPQIGVTARDVSQVGPMGAQVVSVVDESPADKVGLRPDDVITAVNDRTVSSTSQLVGLVRAQKVGEPMTVTYVRDGETTTVELVPVAASN